MLTLQLEVTSPGCWRSPRGGCSDSTLSGLPVFRWKAFVDRHQCRCRHERALKVAKPKLGREWPYVVSPAGVLWRLSTNPSRSSTDAQTAAPDKTRHSISIDLFGSSAP